jgi:hypothetical protein
MKINFANLATKATFPEEASRTPQISCSFRDFDQPSSIQHLLFSIFNSLLFASLCSLRSSPQTGRMVGKKKRNHPDIEELLARPWCYYCKLIPQPETFANSP